MKLHLGCGQTYFEGYVNIDYPQSEHTVQQKIVADQFANLLELRYKQGSIDEIRLHHVFEHFSRAVACGLLASWNSWLKVGGILRIEVPDFEGTAKVALSRFSSMQQKMVSLRHIFGSQEAHWAIHYHGYTPTLLSSYLKLYGFKVEKTEKIEYKGLHNVDITAVKTDSKSRDEFRNITTNYLGNFMVAEVESERMQLKTWMDDYDKQIKQTFAIE